MADYPNARDCEHGRLRRSCERCSDAFLIAALEARLAEVEAERDEAVRELDADDYEDQVCARVAAERRLAEVEQALREAKEALDKTVAVLLTVKPNLDRPYPDALTLTPWTRWCEPLARRVDDARRSARAVLDKGVAPLPLMPSGGSTRRNAPCDADMAGEIPGSQPGCP